MLNKSFSLFKKKTPVSNKIRKEDIGEGIGHFPSNYILGLIASLSASKKINLMSYSDLCWPDGYEASPESGKQEWNNWKKAVKDGQYSSEVIHLIVQYDIDSHAHAANHVMEMHLRKKSKCNVMIFNNRLNRSLYEKTKKVEFTSYQVDNDLLQKLEKSGSCIGYHCNAAEASNHDTHRAMEIFETDVVSLRERGLAIKYFSPHGGPRDELGNSNNALPFLKSKAKELNLKWVHNKVSPSFTNQYSDGGLNNPNRNIDSLSLYDFVHSMNSGSRYRILLHPQYYFPVNPENEHDILTCKNLEDADWYKYSLNNKNKSLRWWKKQWDLCLKRKFHEC